MDKKIDEILIIIFLLIIFLAPLLTVILLVNNNIQANHIKQLEIEINSLKFEQEYTDYVLEDGDRQL